MTRTSNPDASALEAAWAKLAAARWDDARTLFEESIAARETAEGLEGLSWAAWWLDDAERLFDARRRAHRLYSQRGDMPGAARMAIWLACDELDFNGAFAVAAGWLRRAHRLLGQLDDLPEHGWLAFFEGYLASARGDTAGTLDLAAAASSIGRRLHVPDLEILGLALEGATLVSCARVDEGMRCLDEAAATAAGDQAELPIAGAWAFCFMVTACTTTRDYARASEWCDRIAEFADRYGSRYMLAFCRAEHGALHLWRGRWAEAESALESAVENFLRSRPAMVGGALAGLAELRRQQNRGDEAAALLERAGSSRAAQLCAARQALDRGDPAHAVELLERLLRQLPDERRLQRAPALEVLIRGRAACGEVDEARILLEAFDELHRLAGTEAMRAAFEFARGRVSAAAGDHEQARVFLEDAVDCFDRCGAPFDAAEARAELAESLHSLGRRDAAHGEAEAARVALLELRGSSAGVAPALAELTPREHEVVRLLADGLTNREIAERLVISEHTVHRHVANILRKLEVPSRAAAAAHAVRSGVTVE